MSALKIDRTLNLGFVVALGIQTAGALMWGGAAEARLKTLESEINREPSIAERLVRLEEQMQMARQSLGRIEQRLEYRKGNK